jgi:hypothetical protein
MDAKCLTINVVPQIINELPGFETDVLNADFFSDITEK